jgi:alcohol dehydrogenase class IV
MRYEFATAGRIIFGGGALGLLGDAVKGWGSRTLVASGSGKSCVDCLMDALAAAGIEPVLLPVTGEPTTDLAREGARLAVDSAAAFIIGFGGGSAIDTAKAIAALATNRGDPLDYLEVVGRGQPLREPSLPVIAVPTTAGTGAEVTRNAVLLSPQHAVKASLRSPTMLPRIALVDPELTHSLPPDVTASTGLDALTQLIEPFTSVRANPLTDGLCREGIIRSARSLRRAYRDGADVTAREDLAMASLFGGLALANAGLGAAHGFAGPVGGMFPAPHGAVCAALLPHVMRANLAALRERQPDHPALTRYAEIAALVTGRPDAAAEAGVKWVEELAADLQIPSLRAYGVTEAHVDDVVAKTAAASSTKANPLPLSRDELTDILLAAL